jgi:hypothetical protein
MLLGRYFREMIVLQHLEIDQPPGESREDQD